MATFFLIGLMVAVLLVVATFKWPQIGLAIQLVGILLTTIVVYYLGFRGGVSYALLGMVLFGLIIFVLKEKVRVFNFSAQEILAMALAAYMALTLLYTPTPLYGRRKVLLFVAVCIVLMVACRMFSSTREMMAKTLKVLAWISAFVLMFYTYLFITARGVLTSPGRFGEEERIVGNLGALFLSWTGATAVVLTSYLILGRTHIWTKLFATIVILGGMVVIVATGSRGPFVGLLGGAVLAFLGGKGLIRAAFMIVLVTALISLGLHLGPAAGRERIATGFEKYSLEKSGRSELYRLGWQHYLSNPAVGGGAGSFAHHIGGGDRRIYPHNLFLEVAGETGTIGLAFMLAMLAFCIRPILRLKSKQEPLFAVPGIIQWLFWVGLANAMVSFDIPEQRTLFASIGLLAAVRRWPRVDESLLAYDETAYEFYPSLEETEVSY